MKKDKQNILLIIFIFVALIFLVLFTNKLPDNIGNNGDIIITEIMASNKKTIMDSDFEYSDYIELYNKTDKDINLEGFYLSDSQTSDKKWVWGDEK